MLSGCDFVCIFFQAKERESIRGHKSAKQWPQTSPCPKKGWKQYKPPTNHRRRKGTTISPSLLTILRVRGWGQGHPAEPLIRKSPNGHILHYPTTPPTSCPSPGYRHGSLKADQCWCRMCSKNVCVSFLVLRAISSEIAVWISSCL